MQQFKCLPRRCKVTGSSHTLRRLNFVRFMVSYCSSTRVCHGFIRCGTGKRKQHDEWLSMPCMCPPKCRTWPSLPLVTRKICLTTTGSASGGCRVEAGPAARGSRQASTCGVNVNVAGEGCCPPGQYKLACQPPAAEQKQLSMCAPMSAAVAFRFDNTAQQACTITVACPRNPCADPALLQVLLAALLREL